MYVLSREGEYYFIEYSSCRFRTTQAFPGRTGGVSLEESEEEEGGEGLKGTSPAKMLLGRCLTPLWKDGCPAATTEGPEARGLFGDTERGHLQEPGWGRPSLKGHPWLPPPLPRQLIQGGRRWDTPRGGHKGHCHSWVLRHHDLALAHGHSRVGLPPLIPPRRRKGPAPDLQISKSCSPHLQGEGGRW